MIGEYKLNEIYNEDCYEAIKKIPDKSIDLIIIDPPYLFTTGGESKREIEKRAKKHSQEYKKVYGHCANIGINNIAEEIFDISSGFNYKLLDEMDRAMKEINIYIWCSKKQVQNLLKHYEDKNCNIDILTWHKDDPIPMCGNSYLSDTEYCIFARSEKVRLYGSVDTKRKYYISHCNRSDKQLYDHPTIKPLKIIKNLIINSSNENDIIADFFLGSGTTCVAAKELNRQYIGFEIDKQYYEIAKKRLNGINANGQQSIFTDFDKEEKLF